MSWDKKMYNHLTDNLKEINIIRFKENLYKLLVNKCFYALDDFQMRNYYNK